MVRPNEPDILRLGIYHTQIRPKTRRYFFSYRDQSGVLVIQRVNREKNSASILFSNSSSVNSIILLFGVSFSEFWKSKLREKFGKCGSILKQTSSSAVRKRTRERRPVQPRKILGEIVVLRFVVIFISKVCKKVRVLETVHI